MDVSFDFETQGKNLLAKLGKAERASVDSLSALLAYRINCCFEEKVAHLMMLMEEASRKVPSFCRYVRLVSSWAVRNQCLDEMEQLISNVQNFIDNHWNTTKEYMEEVGRKLVSVPQLPYKFMEADEIVCETQKIIEKDYKKVLLNAIAHIIDLLEDVYENNDQYGWQSEEVRTSVSEDSDLQLLINTECFLIGVLRDGVIRNRYKGCLSLMGIHGKLVSHLTVPEAIRNSYKKILIDNIRHS